MLPSAVLLKAIIHFISSFIKKSDCHSWAFFLFCHSWAHVVRTENLITENPLLIFILAKQYVLNYKKRNLINYGVF